MSTPTADADAISVLNCQPVLHMNVTILMRRRMSDFCADCKRRAYFATRARTRLVRLAQRGGTRCSFSNNPYDVYLQCDRKPASKMSVGIGQAGPQFSSSHTTTDIWQPSNTLQTLSSAMAAWLESLPYHLRRIFSNGEDLLSSHFFIESSAQIPLMT